LVLPGPEEEDEAGFDEEIPDRETVKKKKKKKKKKKRRPP
jgi:hypothetical protein